MATLPVNVRRLPTEINRLIMSSRSKKNEQWTTREIIREGEKEGNGVHFDFGNGYPGNFDQVGDLLSNSQDGGQGLGRKKAKDDLGVQQYLRPARNNYGSTAPQALYANQPE